MNRQVLFISFADCRGIRNLLVLRRWRTVNAPRDFSGHFSSSLTGTPYNNGKNRIVKSKFMNRKRKGLKIKSRLAWIKMKCQCLLVPPKKKVAYSLRYIYGVGPARADQVVKEAGLKPDMRAVDLTEEQLNKILHVITEHKWVVEGDLRRDIAGNLKRLQAINCYRGIRHRRGLPVRGQRTSTNARTRKGPRKTIGVTKAKE